MKMGEIDIHGVLVAPLLVWMALAFATTSALHRLLARVGFYRLVWHPALFDLAVFVVLLGGFVVFLQIGTMQ